MDRVARGMIVVGPSGRRIGVVVDVGRDTLRVRLIANSGGDVWLDVAAVFTVEDETVTLICEEDGLHRYEVKGA